MAKDKSPAFQFYPDSWLSSKDISLMTPAEEGAYIRLLCYAWLEPDCGLPDDDKELAKLSRLGAAWAKGSGLKIRKKFGVVEGRLFNERLLLEKHKQQMWSKKSSDSGKLGAESRWGGHSKKMATPLSIDGGTAIATPMAKNGSSSSSLSLEDPPTPFALAERYRGFNAFREAWPDCNCLGEDDAARLWISYVDIGTIQPGPTPDQAVMEGLGRWKESESWHEEGGKYIPNMAKWMREKKWKDRPLRRSGSDAEDDPDAGNRRYEEQKRIAREESARAAKEAGK